MVIFIVLKFGSFLTVYLGIFKKIHQAVKDNMSHRHK